MIIYRAPQPDHYPVLVPIDVMQNVVDCLEAGDAAAALGFLLDAGIVAEDES